MRSAIVFAMLMIAAPAMAQTTPKPVTTFRVEATHAPLYTIDAGGAVTIDWRRVEAAAHGADLTDRDTARALMAVRDGTAKPAK